MGFFALHNVVSHCVLSVPAFLSRTQSIYRSKTSKTPVATSGPKTETFPSQSLNLRYVSAGVLVWWPLEGVGVGPRCVAELLPIKGSFPMKGSQAGLAVSEAVRGDCSGQEVWFTF